MAQPAEQRLRMTYDEYLDWWGERTRGEWVDGEVIVFMPPRNVHQEVVDLLGSLLYWFVRSFNLGVVRIGDFEMRLIPGRKSRIPDILFIAREHLDRLTDMRLEGPADLVVEVISPDSVTRDRRDKLIEYAAAGIREYWLADPRPRRQWFMLYRLNAAGTYEAVEPDAQGRYHSTVLPGFRFDPAWLWQDPLPDPLTLMAMIAPEALRRALGEPTAR